MHDPHYQPQTEPPLPKASKSIDWYAEGDGRAVEVEGVIVAIRYLGRKGRRARIIIEAPGGAVFKPVT